jgi:hypothetical protein
MTHSLVRDRPVLLSVLSDLLQDKRAAPFVLEWRSPRDRSTALPNLLLGIWEEADRSRGISDARGVLATTSHPLAGTAQRAGGGSAPMISGLPLELAATMAGSVDDALGFGAAGSGGTAAAQARARSPAGAATYGFLRLERRQLLERIAAASDGDLLMDKVNSGASIYKGRGAALGSVISLLPTSRPPTQQPADNQPIQPPFIFQVHACLSQVGFDAVAPLLPPRQLAALAVVREYVGFRQGEVWRDIRAAFEAEGLQLSDEER